MTPASVSSLDNSSQQVQSDTAASIPDHKSEVRQQDDAEESDSGGGSKGGKLGNVKMEESPVKIEVKKEECSAEGGKVVPMDTSATPPMSIVKTEDKKPEVKKELKEEQSSDVAVSQAPAKKKSMKKFLSSLSLR